ncbi:MAG TPA: tetratricopeptide repeat protein [Saprospiraceae bacterium]|nr:tetratricopeptide repeat protein [Saprospiraceae bacterium]
MIALEKEVAKSPTNANITQLIDLYAAWLQEHLESSKLQKAVLEKQVTVGTEHLRYAQALSALQTLLIDYPEDAETPDRLLKVGDILTKINKGVAAQVLYQSFAEKYPNHPQTAELTQKYPATMPVDTFILSIGKQIFGDTTNTLNENAARQYVDVCEAYALVYHGTDQAVEYLHKASETARTLRSTAKALAIYEWILRGYPDHKRSAQALFLKGFTYDNDLKDFETAKTVYTEFLRKYPNDEFASSAQFLLENLGKSDDELLKALQEKAAQNKSGDSIQ